MSTSGTINIFATTALRGSPASYESTHRFLAAFEVFEKVNHHLDHVEDEVHHYVLQCMLCHSNSHNLDLSEPISDSPSISTIWASSPATQSARETKIAVALHHCHRGAVLREVLNTGGGTCRDDQLGVQTAFARPSTSS